MRRPAGAGDDDLEAAPARALGEGDEPVGRAVGGDDLRFVGDAERVERLGRVLIVAQSDWLPMTMATGFAADFAASANTNSDR